ncbi:MAG TPA: T9SS type A sorting domain-containing protein [Saprospiraceae bacterium]|nr:T9SS type A sorting domain-containing protein [Saprospiraceae bacterium]
MYTVKHPLVALGILMLGWFAFSAHRPHVVSGCQPFPFNSSVAFFFLDQQPSRPEAGELLFGGEQILADSTPSTPRVLMLNYSTYDTSYANKMHRLVQRHLPTAMLTDFWEGSADDLTNAVANQDVVVIAYPSNGQASLLKSYGKALTQYVRQGGMVLLTGTHEYGILQQYGLFDLDYGYFCADPSIHQSAAESPLFTGVSTDFSLRNYAYPLDVSDSAFLPLADVKGYPVVGYKINGLGKVVYLGLEFYYDEAEANRILANTLQWLLPPKPAPAVSAPSANADPPQGGRFVRSRREEILYAGSGSVKVDNVDIKIYPNPYYSKATLDIDLNKPNMVNVEMTNEAGQIVAVVLPRKQLNSGFYRLELPNLPAGIYFVQCGIGERSIMRKVVKAVGD